MDDDGRPMLEGPAEVGVAEVLSTISGTPAALATRATMGRSVMWPPGW
jgi:hypothetical protein